MAPPAPSEADRPGAATVVPVALAVAAGAHVAALPAHRGQGAAVGALFLAVAVVQMATAVVLARGGGRGRWARTGIAAGTAGLLALWAWSRTVGVPVGPHAGAAEAVGAPDLLAAAAQATVLGALWLRPGAGARGLRRPVPALAVVALAVALGGARSAPGPHGAPAPALAGAGPAVAGGHHGP